MDLGKTFTEGLKNHRIGAECHRPEHMVNEDILAQINVDKSVFTKAG
ncbi:MAG: hypothetical protein HUJ74_01645 [Lachnospiraceae bacterium]|nr:hypothetical protein [Lachnospiraceae bacterium]